MSKLKVTTISDPDNDNTALTIDSSGNVTASQGFVPSTQLSHRNIIINGAMQVSQRGDYTSATSVIDNYYLDRWRVWVTGVTANLQQISTNQPNSSSLTKSARLTASSSATGDLRFNQPIEFPSNYGGQTVTLSAWVKTNSSNCRMYFYNDGYSTSTETAPITADEQWHYTTLTITVATGLNDFIPVIGIDGSASAQVSISSGEYVEITGVQLEVGSVATPFEHRSFDEELARCQRYYQTYVQAGMSGYIEQSSANDFFGILQMPCQMRATPSATCTSASNIGVERGSLFGITSVSGVSWMYGNNLAIGFNMDTSKTRWHVAWCRIQNLKLDAEL